MSTVIKVGGMSCQGCVKNVKGVLSAVPGVNSVEVSLEQGEARVEHGEDISVERLKEAVRNAGFDAD